MGHTEKLMNSTWILLSHRSHGGTFVNHLPRTDSAVRTGTLLFSLRNPRYLHKSTFLQVNSEELTPHGAVVQRCQ